MLQSPDSYFPVDETFSRQQVQLRTGISDDVLGFWIKQGLLRPLPSVRRSHRRFAFYQLHIAALLNAMRSLGANVGVLRKFAGMFQTGFTIWEASGLDASQILKIELLCERLSRFAKGEKVPVASFEGDDNRTGIAASEQEIVANWLDEDRGHSVSLELASFAKALSVVDARSASWATSLVENLVLVGHSNDPWIAWIDPSGEPRIAPPDHDHIEGDEGPLAAFYIPVAKLVRRIWTDRLESAEKRNTIMQHNSELRHLKKLELRDPADALAYRHRRGIPDDWADIYQIIREGDDMDG